MAETVGAVASVAGLVSLSMQLIESTQKLKKLYNTSRDAPSTVADLCFELETMSLSLRQLEMHRNADIIGDQLLGRCMATCARMVTKIEEAVGKLERLLQRSRAVGRVYMAFKEPEIESLLTEMEKAKSSLTLAYMSYCHAWNVGQAMKHAALEVAQSAILSNQNTRLQALEQSVHTGHATILARLDRTPDRQMIHPIACHDTHTRLTTQPNTAIEHRRKRRARRFRVSLPRWLVDCAWEFGLRESESGWEFQIHSVNLRPRTSFTFDVVRSGNVPAVRRLLESKELSVRDHFPRDNFWTAAPDLNIFELAAKYGNTDLCEFLLAETEAFRTDTTMCSAIECYLAYSPSRSWLSFNDPRQKISRLYEIFVRHYGLSIFSDEVERPATYWKGTITNNKLLTDESVRALLASQSIPYAGYPFEARFEIAMRSNGWPAETFFDFLRCDDPLRLATATDSRARTALHWAAEHLAYWVGTDLARDWTPDEAPADSYAALLVKLISVGADVHALDADHETPFMKLIRRTNTYNIKRPLPRLCARWNEILTESNCSISGYVKTENKLWKLASDENRIKGTHASHFPVCEVRLGYLEGSGLAVELKYCRALHIMEYRPPPGAWKGNGQIPLCIYWHPRDNVMVEQWFLRKQRTVYIYSKFRSVTAAASTSDCFFSKEQVRNRWRDMFRTVQDDDGQVARLLRQDEKWCEPPNRLHRRRASSAPPPPTMIENDGFDFDPLTVPISAVTSISDAHKCVLDSKWKTSRNHRTPFWLECMQGRCHSTWNYDFERPYFHWEEIFFRDLNKVDVALRYADRFHPELRPIFEAEFEKTRRWAQVREGVAGDAEAG